MKRNTKTNMMMGSAKVAGLIILGLNLMGNKGCEDKPVVEGPRQLKWYADAGAISSPPVNFGDAGSFDFGYVASEQLNGVLFNNGFATSISGPGIQIGDQGPELATAAGMYQKMFGSKVVGDELYFSTEARCLVKLPDVMVSGKVLAYELTDGQSFEFGFNQNGPHTGIGVGAKFSVRLKQLMIQMYGIDSAKDLASGKSRSIASPLVTQKGKDTDGKVTIDYNSIGGGYSWYKNSPLSKLTEGALQQGVTSVKDEMNKVNWTTKVLDLKAFEGSNPFGDKGVVIKGGTDVNLKTGDQVAFYNERTMWKGKPCESDFYGFIRTEKTPFAYGEVIHADRYFSTVAITKRVDNTEIKPGWRVELFKRIEDVKKEEEAAKKEASQKVAKK